MMSFRKSLLAAATVVCWHLSVHAGQAPPQLTDFGRARDEAVQLLQSLIRIDTSNPPGNETRAAEFIKAVFAKDGLASEIYTLERGRGSVVARIRGSGRRRPLLLMAHTDVVGVERDKWTVDPFAAVIRNGSIYGRGAIDDKDTVAAAMVVMLTLKRLKVPLDRDVIFLAEAGEEGTPETGIAFMVEKHWPAIEAEFAIAEGGDLPVRDGRLRYVGVATTEKAPNTFRMIARGTSGHGSMPRLDNPIVHLAAAIAKIGAWQPPMRLIETTRTFFERTAGISAPDEAYLLTHLTDPAVQDTLRRTNVTYNSMLRTSISPNIVKGGFRVNVIPGDAEATLDVRSLPGEDLDRLVVQLKELVDDPAVEIVRVPSNRPLAPASPLDSEVLRALERAGQAVYPGVPTIPMMLTGATDMAQLRAKGVKAYGISERQDEKDPSAHGNDERISIDALGKYVEYLYRTVIDVAASSSSR